LVNKGVRWSIFPPVRMVLFANTYQWLVASPRKISTYE
jgi:hypothetical protein